MTHITHTEEYKGHKIEIKREDWSSKAHDAMTLAPALCFYDGNYSYYYSHSKFFGCSQDKTDNPHDIMQAVFSSFDTSKITKALVKEIYELLKPWVCEDDIADYIDYRDCANFNDYLSNILYAILSNIDAPSGYYANYRKVESLFDAMQAVLKLLGVDSYAAETKGYSQGDCSLVLMIASAEYKTDYEHCETKESFERDIQLFSAWQWGDVYYYNVDSIDANCGGFYGGYDNSTDMSYGGAIRAAMDEIDNHEKNIALDVVNIFLSTQGNNHAPQ